MSSALWWRRFDAARWMHRLLVVQTILLAWVTAAILLPGFFSGLFAPTLLAALLPGALTALSAWLTGAWARERAWSWWAELALGLAGLPYLTFSLVDGGLSPGDGIGVLAAAGWTLLLHPDSRARIRRPATPSRPASWRAHP
jgi:hypothetical protein